MVDSIGSQKTIEEIIRSSQNRESTRNIGELGKDDFLQLLVTQLRYQDPLNPMEDKEFIAQMAQFTSLEQMQNMNTSFTAMKGFNMIGKYISGTVRDESTGSSNIVEGYVTSVKISQGKTYAIVDGVEVPVENITNVAEGLTRYNTNISLYTGLIGHKVNGGVYDAITGDIVEVSGTVKSIKRGLYEDYMVLDGVEVEISSINNLTPSTDPDYKKNYLDENIGKEISVTITNRSNGKKVPVTAVLKEYSISEDGKISAVLDQINVPIDSLKKITD